MVGSCRPSEAAETTSMCCYSWALFDAGKGRCADHRLSLGFCAPSNSYRQPLRRVPYLPTTAMHGKLPSTEPPGVAEYSTLQSKTDSHEILINTISWSGVFAQLTFSTLQQTRVLVRPSCVCFDVVRQHCASKPECMSSQYSETVSDRCQNSHNELALLSLSLDSWNFQHCGCQDKCTYCMSWCNKQQLAAHPALWRLNEVWKYTHSTGPRDSSHLHIFLSVKNISA
jgi:hypothetical protein